MTDLQAPAIYVRLDNERDALLVFPIAKLEYAIVAGSVLHLQFPGQFVLVTFERGIDPIDVADRILLAAGPHVFRAGGEYGSIKKVELHKGTVS